MKDFETKDSENLDSETKAEIIYQRFLDEYNKFEDLLKKHYKEPTTNIDDYNMIRPDNIEMFQNNPIKSIVEAENQPPLNVAKKRGRKPNPEKANLPKPEPKKRGRKPNPEKANLPKLEPKKRGRKPKAILEAQEKNEKRKISVVTIIKKNKNKSNIITNINKSTIPTIKIEKKLNNIQPITEDFTTKIYNTNEKLKENKKEKINVLFVASECQPFCATGGLADVVGSLPQFINNQTNDIDVRVILPLYSDIPAKFKDNFKFLGHKEITLSWRHIYCGVFKYVLNKTTYYFIDNEYFFKRNGGIYSYFDDGERFAYMCKAILDTFDITGFTPDIIHANDWQSSLIPIYLKTCYHDECHNNIKSIFTIHNINYQGKFDINIMEDLFGIDQSNKKLLEFDKSLNLLKGAILCCDKLSTVSPSYAEEIKSAEHGMGLENIVRENSHKLIGILNGIDYNFYNPNNDKSLFATYDKDTFEEGKKKNKLEFQKMLGLPEGADIPMISIVARLNKLKGMDLVLEGINQVLGKKVQLVTVGCGELVYENFLRDLENNYSSKVRALIGYSNDLARKAYAASDIFIMPSKSEPCGLSQMVASKYGAIPIIRETGGLKDSIKDFGCEDGGNGYTFKPYASSDLIYSINRALNDYKDTENWNKKIKTVMSANFSWNKSAEKYENLYKEILGR